MFYLAKAVKGTMVPGDDASEVGLFQQSELPPNVAFEWHRRLIAEFFDKSLKH
jgi:hypothetical protein